MAAGPDAVLKQGPEAVLEVAMLPETRGNILAKVIMGEAVTVAGADGLSAVRRAMCCWMHCATDLNTATRLLRRSRNARPASMSPVPARSTPPCNIWRNSDWCAPTRKGSGAFII